MKLIDKNLEKLQLKEKKNLIKNLKNNFQNNRKIIVS